MATLSVGMGTSLTSCKDNYDELRDEMRRDNVDLNKKISDLTAVVDNLKQLQEACKANCEAAIAALNAQIDLLKGDLANKADKSWVDGEIARLERELVKVADFQATVERLDSAISEINEKLGDKADKSYVDSLLEGKVDSSYVDSLINALSVDLNNLRTELTEDIKDLRDELEAQINVLTLEIGKKVDQSTYDAFVAAQEEINRQVEANSIAIASINETLGELQDVIAAVEEKADKAYAQAMSNLVHINKLIAAIETLQTETIPALEGRLDALETEAIGLRIELEELQGKVDANTAAIEELNKKVDRLMKRAEQQLTSLSVERVYNHVYGTLNTPFGVQSNVLLSFWGWADQPVDFPNTGAAEFSGTETVVLTQADRDMIGWSNLKKEYDGLLIRGVDDGNYAGNAGRVYFRTNPGRVTMEDKTFTLVNTRDEESGVKLEAPVKSDEVLMYGYTDSRSADDNGFYCAKATLSTKEDVFAVKAEIDESLKDAAKNVLKERSLSSLAVLSKMIYDQVSNVMPQLAIKAAYNVNYIDAEGNEAVDAFSVYSPSNMAATAVRPLSFSFLYGQSVPGRRLPILDPLTELINADDFKVDLNIGSIEFEDQTFSISTPQINVNDEGKITITADVVDNDGNVIGHLDNVVVDSSDLTDSITSAIESAIGEMTGEINEKVSEMVNNIQNQIETQINEMLDSIKGQINDQIANLINGVNNKVAPLIDRFNQFLPKYNQLAALINRVMDNPNAYLQPLMVYQSSVDKNLHVLSNNINRPSEFVLNGGDAIYLHPTTRTGEVVAPAFKKFVAVTNAWKTNDPTTTAQSGDTACKQVVNSINAAGNMDEILNGEDMHVVFYVPGTAKGMTFEIVYQALDYHGVTSTQKYYVTVK